MCDRNHDGSSTDVFDVDFVHADIRKSFELKQWNIKKKTLSQYFPRISGLEYIRGDKTFGLEVDDDIMRLRQGITEYTVLCSEPELGAKLKLNGKQIQEVKHIVNVYEGEDKSSERSDEMKKSSEKVGNKSGRKQVRLKRQRKQNNEAEEKKSKPIKVTWHHRNSLDGKGTFYKQGLPDGGDKSIDIPEDQDYSHDEIKRMLIEVFMTPRTRGYFEESFVEIDSNDEAPMREKGSLSFCINETKGFWKYYQRVMSKKKRFQLSVKTTWFPGYQDRIVMTILEDWKKKSSEPGQTGTGSESSLKNGAKFRNAGILVSPSQNKKARDDEAANDAEDASDIAKNSSRLVKRSPAKEYEKYLPRQDTSDPCHRKGHNFQIEDPCFKVTTPMQYSTSPALLLPPSIDLTASTISDQNVSPNKINSSRSFDEIDRYISHESFDARVNKAAGIEPRIQPKPAGPSPQRALGISHKQSNVCKKADGSGYADSQSLVKLKDSDERVKKTSAGDAQTSKKIDSPPPCNDLQSKLFKTPAPAVKNLKLSDIARTPTHLVQDIPYKDLKFMEYLGSGGSGTVLKGEWNLTNVAIKAINILNNRPKMILKEVEALREATHPNVVQILGVSHHKQRFFIVMELIVGHDLNAILFELKLPNLRKNFIAKQLTRVVAFLHSHPKKFIHCDIKPLNILLDSHQRLKLCDLGLAKIKNIAETNIMQTSLGSGSKFVGTPMYMAPEVLLRRSEPDEASDTWSTGGTLVELYTEKDLWILNEDDPMKDIYNKLRNGGTPKIGPLVGDDVPESLREVLEKCFIYNTKDQSKPQRITSRELASFYSFVADQ